MDFEGELLHLCKPYAGVKSAPERILAERMTGFIGELFAFVSCPEIASENNAAERAIRPAVVDGGVGAARQEAQKLAACCGLSLRHGRFKATTP
ncbi:MAG: hypothetical protein A2Z18_05935 [Armatimonadetes bacterium RBG_16_58_9]|nr:MAG: hypothetical protein A2Z18_05935 [Armatimonadetes bacterium RBG_16_58_9]